MRKSDIAYVPNPASPTYVPPLEEMDLRTLIKNFLCGKSHGLVSVCKQCESKCAYGQRALDLLSGKASSSPDLFVPYGQTILARMKAEKEEKKEEEKHSKKKERKKRQDDGNWYFEAMAAEHPYEWVAEHFGIPVGKARRKVYQYRYAHKDKLEIKEEPETVYKPVQPEPPKKAYSDFEAKLDELMRLEEEYKRKIAEHQQEVDRLTKLLADVKDKTDLLVRAMDILET